MDMPPRKLPWTVGTEWEKRDHQQSQNKLLTDGRGWQKKYSGLGRVPECDSSVTSVARKSEPITSWETTKGMPRVALVVIFYSLWLFVNWHLMEKLAAPFWKDVEGSLVDRGENTQSWSLNQISSSQWVSYKGAPSNCKICGRVFAAEKKLKIHIIVYHGGY